MKRSTLPILAGCAAALTVAVLTHRRGKPRARRVAIVTGGSRGLGLAIAHRFGRAGDRLVLAARHLPELEEAREKLLSSGDAASPEDILLVPCDLTDPAQAQSLIQQTLARFGTIEVLINNAGIIEVGPFQNQTLQAFERAMQVNFFAALHTVQAALPHLRRGSAIVNIASVGGKIPVPHLAPYVAAKFALVGLSETLHAELRHLGIRVTTVCPGLMRTGGEAHAIFSGQQEKEKRWFNLGAKTPGIATTATHAANKIFTAVESGRAEITITPQAWLAARIHGALPEFSQAFAAAANQLVLPAPASVSASEHIPA